VDGGDLQRRLLVQRRQQTRQALGEHRLPGTGRPGEEQVVPARGGDLDRAAPHGLPDHVTQVGGRSRGGSGCTLVAREHPAAGEMRDHLFQ
jgi:hypothetical protein